MGSYAPAIRYAMDVLLPLSKLRNKRKLFHSEADFQFALAWEIQLLYPGAGVRLEYCPAAAPSMHIDIIVEYEGNAYPIELKYKTLKTEIAVENERYSLKSHGAQDIGKYDFLADIQRIEYLSRRLPAFHQGFAIWLTNDPLYWSRPSRENTIAPAFSLHQGASKQGVMAWAAHAGPGTTKGRTDAIRLTGQYWIQWQEYSRIGSGRNGCFQYAVIRIDRQKEG